VIKRTGLACAHRSVALIVCLLAFTAASAAEHADLLLVNGKVVTVDPQFSIRSALAIRDGRIIAVGGSEIATRYEAPTTIDLRGRTVLPGFIDTHLHPQATSPRAIDPANARSIAELQQMLRQKAKELGPGQWITGYGWAEANLKEKRNIVRADLDIATPDNPVALTRAGGHSVVGNSRALALAHIDRSTPNPLRGVIEHDAQGEPNGIIRERNDLYLKLVPPDTFATLRPSYVASLRRLLSLGLTSVFVAASSIRDEVKEELRPEQPDSAATFKEYRDIYAEYGATLPRAVLEIGYPGAAALCSYPHKTGFGDDRLKLGAVGEAPAVDGGFTGPTAWTTQDYKGQPGFRGQPFFKDEADLQPLADTVARCGWQLGLHAIGDAAINMAVKVYAQALAKYPHPDPRWYLAHFTMTPTTQTLQTMVNAHILAAAQPNFLYTLENRYDETLDGYRLEHINPVALPLKAGVFIAFGSDNLPIDPRVGLYAAVTRKGMSGRVYGADEAVSVQEAIRMYTLDGAYLSWDEHRKGSLEVGKFADLIVLDRDPFTVPPAQLLTMQVDTTIVGGRIVYERQRQKSVDTSIRPVAPTSAAVTVCPSAARSSAANPTCRVSGAQT
jgi:predicted amidohydrolase YtcJ